MFGLCIAHPVVRALSVLLPLAALLGLASGQEAPSWHGRCIGLIATMLLPLAVVSSGRARLPRRAGWTLKPACRPRPTCCGTMGVRTAGSPSCWFSTSSPVTNGAGDAGEPEVCQRDRGAGAALSPGFAYRGRLW